MRYRRHVPAKQTSAALISDPQREWREIRADVVVVLVLDPLQKRHDTISERRRDELPEAFQRVLREHDLHQMALGYPAVKGEEIENHRIHQLAAQRRADDTGPKPPAQGPDLHLREHIAVDESAA